MTKAKIKLYYRNATAEVIGPKHGITESQLGKHLDNLMKKVRALRSIPELRAKEQAYRRLPYESAIAQQVKEIVAEAKENCEILVVLGIGGSALGNIALQTALNPYMYNLDDKQRAGPRLFVFDNIDPRQLSSFLQWLGKRRLRRTIFNVISKSGEASETMSQFMIIRQLLLNRGKRAVQNQVIVTTDPGENPLRRLAIEDKLRCLAIPQDVGGRFSVLSAVGLFSTAMCGIDIDLLLAGARDMDKRVSRRDFYRNPAAINAAIHYHFYNRGKKVSVMMPYSEGLKDLADWYRQLWAESLGKAKDLKGKQVHIGPTLVKALGATDQHSQLQLYLEGPNDKLFTFLQVSRFGQDRKIGPVPGCASELKYLAYKNLSTLLNSEKKATEYALLRNHRPCLTVLFDEINAYTVGQFIYLSEVTTSFTGALFGINPYNQPSVKLIRDAIAALEGQVGAKNRSWARQIRSLMKINGEFLV